MRGCLLSACLAIGLTGILTGPAISAQNEPLFGPPPPPRPVPASDGVEATSLAKPLGAIDTEQPISAVGPVEPSVPIATGEPESAVGSPEPSAAIATDEPESAAGSPEPPALIRDPDQAAKRLPTWPFPPLRSPGHSTTRDADLRIAQRPAHDPGYAEASDESSPKSGDASEPVGDATACSSCGPPACEHRDVCAASSCGGCSPWTIPQLRGLDRMGIRFGGWVEQGITVAANMPGDRYNGTVTFNDRDGEYQLNQVWLYLERKVDEYESCWDVGGRVDFVYGTDARFIQARDGLESNWGQTEPFYQVALPQAYVDVRHRDWTVRAGRFLTVLGLESPMAPDNFFYSHSYAMQYGEPFTHFGLLGMRQMGRFLATAGVHRGNDQFDDTDGLDALNFIGGLSMTSHDERMTGAFAFTATEEGPGVTSYIHSMVATLQLTDRLTYAIQGDYGETWQEVTHVKQTWSGINQYMVYTINACWAAGIRSEWFRDRDGSRVAGPGVGNRNRGPYSGDFYEITLGLNWSPQANLMIRPEVRWDIFDPSGQATNLGAFDAGGRNTQFVFGCDLICTF